MERNLKLDSTPELTVDPNAQRLTAEKEAKEVERVKREKEWELSIRYSLPTRIGQWIEEATLTEVHLTHFDSLLSYDEPVQIRSDVNMYFSMYLQKLDFKLSLLIPEWHKAHENIVKLCSATLVTASYGKNRVRRNIFKCVSIEKKKLEPRTPVTYGQDFYLRVFDSGGPELYLTGCPPPCYDDFSDSNGKIKLRLTENPDRLAMFRIVDPDPNRMIALQDIPVPANFIVCLHHTYTNQLLSVDLTDSITESYTYNHPVNGCTYKDSAGQITLENYWTFITRPIQEGTAESLAQARHANSDVASEEVPAECPSTRTKKKPSTSTSKDPRTSTSKNPRTSTAQFLSTSTAQLPSTSTAQFPGTTTVQFPGTVQNPRASTPLYPSTSVINIPGPCLSPIPTIRAEAQRTHASNIPMIGQNNVICPGPITSSFPEARSSNWNYPPPNVNTVPVPVHTVPWIYPGPAAGIIPVAPPNTWSYPGPSGINYPPPPANPMNYPVPGAIPIPVIGNSMWNYPTNYPSVNYYRYPSPVSNYPTSAGAPHNYYSPGNNMGRSSPVNFPGPSSFPVPTSRPSSPDPVSRPSRPRFAPSLGSNLMAGTRYRGPISNEDPVPKRKNSK